MSNSVFYFHYEETSIAEMLLTQPHRSANCQGLTWLIRDSIIPANGVPAHVAQWSDYLYLAP